MGLTDEELKIKAKYAKIVAGLNTTEATWLGWLKANKVKVALGLLAVIIAIVAALKLV